MKVYLGPPNEAYEHYLQPESLDVLKLMVDDAECTEIVIDGFLSLVPHKDTGILIAELCKKVRLGGKLIVNFVDYDTVNLLYSRNLIDVERINKLLTPTANIVTMTDIESYILMNGLTIDAKSYTTQAVATITGVRK